MLSSYLLVLHWQEQLHPWLLVELAASSRQVVVLMLVLVLVLLFLWECQLLVLQPLAMAWPGLALPLWRLVLLVLGPVHLRAMNEIEMSEIKASEWMSEKSE